MHRYLSGRQGHLNCVSITNDSLPSIGRFIFQNTKVNAITDNHQKMSKREKKELSHGDSPELSDSGISAIAGKRRDGQKGGLHA